MGLRGALSSELASLVWAVSAHLSSRRSRLLLPLHILAEMPLTELKCLLGKIKLARGSLDCGPVPLFESVELHAVSSVCLHTASTAKNRLTRVIVARLRFDTEDMQSSAGRESLHCLSSEILFWWPGKIGRRGTMLTASVVCGKDVNAIEISSAIRPSKQDSLLTIDLHLATPRGAGQVSATDLQVDVNGEFTKFALPGLDVTEECTRRALTSPTGVVCILVVRCSASDLTAFPNLPEKMRSGISMQTSLRRSDQFDALALEMPARKAKASKSVTV
jgi:hypothetical protein